MHFETSEADGKDAIPTSGKLAVCLLSVDPICESLEKNFCCFSSWNEPGYKYL